jgi:uncharacterized protein (DUF983 family)
LDDKLGREMEKYPWVNWSAVCRNAIKDHIESIKRGFKTCPKCGGEMMFLEARGKAPRGFICKNCGELYEETEGINHE